MRETCPQRSRPLPVTLYLSLHFVMSDSVHVIIIRLFPGSLPGPFTPVCMTFDLLIQKERVKQLLNRIAIHRVCLKIHILSNCSGCGPTETTYVRFYGQIQGKGFIIVILDRP